MPGKLEPKAAEDRRGLTPADLFDFDSWAVAVGTPRIARIVPVAPVRPEDILTLAARVRWPGHPPIAQAVAVGLAERGLPLTELSDGQTQGSDRWHVIARQGIDGKIEDFDVLVGTAEFLEDAGIPIPDTVRDLLAEHESKGWLPVLVGACRRGQAPVRARRSLIGILSIELGSSAAQPASAEADTVVAPAVRIRERLRPRVVIPWRRLAGAVVRSITRRRLGIAALILASAAAGVWTSLLTVQADELAVVQRFGRSVATLGPGLHVRPWWPFETATRLHPRAVRTVEIGSVIASDLQPAGVVMVTGDTWPGQSPSASAPTEQGHGVSQLLRVRARVQYGIADPNAFLFNTEGPDGLVASTAEGALRALVAARTAYDCLGRGRPEIADRAARLVQERLDAMACGVAVDAVLLDEIAPWDTLPGLHGSQKMTEGIEAGVRAQMEADRLIADANQRASGLIAFAEQDRAARARAARALLDQAKNYSAAYARDPEGTRRRLLAELVSEVPGGLPELRRILAEMLSSGRKSATMPEGRPR